MKGLMRGTVFLLGVLSLIVVIAWLVMGCASSRQMLVPAPTSQPAEAGMITPAKISQDVAGVKADTSLWAKAQVVANFLLGKVVVNGDGNTVNAGSVWWWALGYLIAARSRLLTKRTGLFTAEQVLQFLKAAGGAGKAASG